MCRPAAPTGPLREKKKKKIVHSDRQQYAYIRPESSRAQRSAGTGEPLPALAARTPSAPRRAQDDDDDDGAPHPQRKAVDSRDDVSARPYLAGRGRTGCSAARCLTENFSDKPRPLACNRATAVTIDFALHPFAGSSISTRDSWLVPPWLTGNGGLPLAHQRTDRDRGRAPPRCTAMKWALTLTAPPWQSSNLIRVLGYVNGDLRGPT